MHRAGKFGKITNAEFFFLNLSTENCRAGEFGIIRNAEFEKIKITGLSLVNEINVIVPQEFML